MVESTTRPICVYAKANLKRNSTRLMVAMCIGIMLAIYGAYVSSRMRNNERYMPTLSSAGNWLNKRFMDSFGNPMSIFSLNCMNIKQARAKSAAAWVMSNMIKPFVNQSGLLNGLINVTQIILIKVYCMSIPVTDAVIGLSIAGLFVSILCLVGSFLSCKMMCLTCLGIHHALIIYFGLQRRCILTNMLCPTSVSSNSTSGSKPAPGCPTAKYEHSAPQVPFKSVVGARRRL